MEDRIELVKRIAKPNVQDTELFLEVQDLILQGYRIAETGTMLDASLRCLRSNPRVTKVVMYKEGLEKTGVVEPDAYKAEDVVVTVDDEPVEEVSPSIEIELPVATEEVDVAEVEPELLDPLEELKTINKRDPLLKFAERKGIVVPDEIKQPASIKKFIKEALEQE